MNAPAKLPIAEIWVYLSGNPLYALILTLLAFQAGVWLYERGGRRPLANPVAIAVVLVAGSLRLADMPYERYFEGAQPEWVAPLFAQSVTAPIAMGVAQQIGASPTLTAVFAVVTGILGAVLGRFVLDAVGCRAWWQRGFALGTAAHGIGTSRAFSVNIDAGRFASLAMGLHGVLGALLVPAVARWL